MVAHMHTSTECESSSPVERETDAVQNLIQKINPRLAQDPAYRVGWHESRLAHQQWLQKQQDQIQDELTSVRKLYRDVFRLASDVRLQVDQWRESGMDQLPVRLGEQAQILQELPVRQQELATRQASLSMDLIRQTNRIQENSELMQSLEERLLKSERGWQDLEQTVQHHVEQMSWHWDEQQQFQFRQEGLQEKSEQLLLELQQFRAGLSEAWDQYQQRFASQENMLSQLILDGQKHQQIMIAEMKHLQGLRTEHSADRQNLLELSEKVIETQKSVENLQAKAQLSLMRGQENLDRTERLQATCVPMLEQMQQLFQQAEAREHDLRRDLGGFDTDMRTMKARLDGAQLLAQRLEMMEQALNQASDREQQAARSLLDSQHLMAKIEERSESLLQRLEQQSRHEDELKQQIDQSRQQSLQLQQQLDTQVCLLDHATEREAEWQRILQDQAQTLAQQSERLQTQEEQTQYWQKLAQQALRRMKELELTQREYVLNQKEHQWLMNQTRQEQTQLQRERQTMQAQVQDLEARMHELAMGMNEAKPQEDVKKSLEQVQAQLLEFRLDMARIRQEQAQTETRVAAATMVPRTPETEEQRTSRRWWG